MDGKSTLSLISSSARPIIGHMFTMSGIVCSMYPGTAGLSTAQPDVHLSVAISSFASLENKMEDKILIKL